MEYRQIDRYNFVSGIASFRNILLVNLEYDASAANSTHVNKLNELDMLPVRATHHLYAYPEIT